MSVQKIVAFYPGPMHTEPEQQKVIALLRCGHTLVRPRGDETTLQELDCDKCDRRERTLKKVKARGLDK